MPWRASLACTPVFMAERLRVVRGSAREQLRPLLVESGDLRALAMEIDTDVNHRLGLLLVPTSCLPRHTAHGGRLPRGPLLHGIKWCPFERRSRKSATE